MPVRCCGTLSYVATAQSVGNTVDEDRGRTDPTFGQLVGQRVAIYDEVPFAAAVVTFQNLAERNRAKRMLYVIMSPEGRFISANHRLIRTAVLTVESGPFAGAYGADQP